MESYHSTLTKSHEQLQIRLKQFDMPSTSTPTTTCDHAIVIEENARLKNELANLKGKSPIDDLLQSQRPHNGKEGLGYVAKKKKKNKKNKKKAKPAQANGITIASGSVTRDTTTRNNSAGPNHPYYILFEYYYGVVYATYVGPNVDFIEGSIWVQKTYVANVRGPIEKWGPKSKQ